MVRTNLAFEFHFTTTQSTALASSTDPRYEKTSELPKGIQSKTTGHDGVVFEMTFKKPFIRMDIHLRKDQPLIEFSALLSDFHDAVHHEHGRERKLPSFRTEQTARKIHQFCFVVTFFLLHKLFISRIYTSCKFTFILIFYLWWLTLLSGGCFGINCLGQ